jgi:hypothetical protein
VKIPDIFRKKFQREKKIRGILPAKKLINFGKKKSEHLLEVFSV